ncbi:MAG: U32 family peptidase, partial [Candidatus Helarchaeota archaeon]
MELTVPTNWDPDLIEEFNKYPIRDVYGAIEHTIVGGGRPTVILPAISEEEVAEHIKLIHDKKLEFSYVLNAPCLNNMEYDPKYHEELLKYLQWISDIGTDNIIVTIPFLIQLIKEQFPKLKIRISTIAHVNSVNRAKFYEKLGADEITPDVMINRDFKTLEQMQKATKSDLVLLLTDGCLYQCPFRYYHYNMMGHASQTYNQFNRYHIDTCILNCTIIKFSDPTEAIKSRWVRPEDLGHYEAIGIKRFKIGGRRLPTPRILRSIKAYSEQKYEGNLTDIIQGFTWSYGGIQKKDPNKRFGDSLDNEKKANFIIDNRKLDGFIEFFKKQNCIAMCDECNYCEKWAKKAIFLDIEQTD